MSDDYHVFLIASLVFTGLLLNEICHLMESPFDWLMMEYSFVCLIDDFLGFFITSESGGVELASTIQCASPGLQVVTFSVILKYK